MIKQVGSRILKFCFRWSLRLGLGLPVYGLIRFLGRSLMGSPRMVEKLWKEDFALYRELVSLGGGSAEAVSMHAGKATLQSRILKISGYGFYSGLSDRQWRRQVDLVNELAFLEAANVTGKVLLVASFSTAQEAVTRFIRHCPKPSIILGKASREELRARQGALSKADKSMLTAKVAILAQRALQRGDMVVAAGNALNVLSDALPCKVHDREISFPRDWAKLAVSTSTPVWFLKMAFAQNGKLKLIFEQMTLAPDSGSADPNVVDKWVQFYADSWAETMAVYPGLVRPEWIARWRKAREWRNSQS